MVISEKILAKKFLKLEENLNLFAKKLDGVYFWERIRFQVYRKILISLKVIGNPHNEPNKSIIHKIYFALKALYYFIFKNPFLFKKADIVFFGHPRRKILEDGKWWDIYCDPIINYLDEYNYLYLEKPYLNKHLKPAKTKNIKYLDFIYLIIAFKRKLSFLSSNLSKEDIDYIIKIEEKIEEYFGIKIEVENIVYKMLIERKSLLGLYKCLLKKINPKVVVLVVSYGKETFIEACKLLKIPVIELQHGLIHKHHFGYSFSGIKRNKKAFPDYFLVFGDFWKNCVEFPINNNRILSMGYPFLENELSKYVHIPKKNQILFISQGPYGKKLSKFALELSERKDIDYKIIYKLHPGEYKGWQDIYPWLAKNGRKIKVIDNDYYSFYKLMAESKIQVGISSTAIYEGLCFGLKTYLYNESSKILEYLLRKGYAERIDNVEDLIKKIESGVKIEKYDSNYFFKSKSTDSISNFFKGLLK